MIEHLKISNFMAFEELDIPVLKRVNLIAGKNNSGKTCLLDAIRILEANGDSTVVNHILDKRNSFRKGLKEPYESLFNRYTNEDELYINDCHLISPNNPLSSVNDYSFFFIDKGLEHILDTNSVATLPNDKAIYVPFSSDDFRTLGFLWENVVLTPKEDDVYEIVRDTIEPSLIRFDVGSKIVRIRLKNTDKPVPLGTLGDGVNRILLIALSLANAQNKVLLIDELELGLHYSAMEKLWEMIFKYAVKWDIQVFATTHSQDAIRTFHYVASDEKYLNEAEYIRLQHSREGKNEAIIFDGERLKNSLELQLEIR